MYLLPARPRDIRQCCDSELTQSITAARETHNSLSVPPSASLILLGPSAVSRDGSAVNPIWVSAAPLRLHVLYDSLSNALDGFVLFTQISFLKFDSDFFQGQQSWELKRRGTAFTDGGMLDGNCPMDQCSFTRWAIFFWILKDLKAKFFHKRNSFERKCRELEFFGLTAVNPKTEIWNPKAKIWSVQWKPWFPLYTANF